MNEMDSLRTKKLVNLRVKGLVHNWKMADVRSANSMKDYWSII